MYLFRVNKEKWAALVALRGWKHPITALARRTGFGKSYCSQAINGGIPISDDFMLAIVRVSGASIKEVEEWASLFEIALDPNYDRRTSDKKDAPFQKDNYPKFYGEKPYDKYSTAGETRAKDQAHGLERLKLPVPIPASEYYDNGRPDNYFHFKNIYHKNR